MSSVVDLCKRFGIRHPKEQSICIRHGQRKPTCGCAVAESSRLQALSRLERLKDTLDSGNRARSDPLFDIASLLLCKLFHQYQAEENVQRWKSNLRGYAALRRQAAPTIASNSVTPARQVAVPQAAPPSGPTLESCSNRQLMREIRRLGRVRRVKLLHGLFEITNEGLESQEVIRGQPNNSAPRDDSRGLVDVARLNSSRTSSTPVGSPNRINANQPASSISPAVDTVALIPQSPTLERTPAVETIRPSQSAVANPVVTLPRPEPPARAPSPLRQSQVDCVVCTLSYEEEPGDQWECRRCLNRVHLHCFDAWRASQLPGRVTCIHCRCQVSEGRTV